MKSRKNPYHGAGKKKKWDSKFIVGIFIAVIMATSIMGFIAGYTTTDVLEVNDQQFTRSDLGYATIVNDQQVKTFNLPDAVDDIDISPEAIHLFTSTKVLTITYDPEEPQAETLALIQYNLENTLHLFSKFPVRAVTNNSKFPTMLQQDCANATSTVPVLKFTQSNETSIQVKDNCIIAQGFSGYDLQRLHDRLIFILSGLME